MERPLANSAVMTAEKVQPVPCVCLVSKRLFSNVYVSFLVKRKSLALFKSAECPPLITTPLLPISLIKI